MLGLERWRRMYATIPQPLRSVAYFFAKQLEDATSGKLEFIRRASFDEPFFWGGAEAFYEGGKRQLIHSEIKAKLNGTSSASVVGAYFKEFLQEGHSRDPLNWMTFIDLKLRLPE